MNDCRWIVCFDTAMIIRSVYSTNEENASNSAKYYCSIYPYVKVMDEQQLNKALEEDFLIKTGRVL